MLQTIPTIPLSGETPAFQIGLTAKRGGLITIDQPLNEYFKAIAVGTTGGNVLVRGVDNQIIPFLDRPAGSWIYVLGYEVVSAATVDGQALTTTADNLTWIGGF